MIILFDADSLVYSSCYKKKENPEDEKWNTLEDAKFKFDEVYMSIINTIEETYEIDTIHTFNGAKGNFRKEISKEYKANRKVEDIPPILNDLHKYVWDNYNGVSAIGVETDDAVARLWKATTDLLGKESCLIVSIDKDYKQLPCIIYDYHYKKKCYYNINEEEAINNFYTQMITGDNSDNVKICKGYGIKYCEKLFKGVVSDFGYKKRTYMLYKEIYSKKARERFIETYRLLKLKTD